MHFSAALSEPSLGMELCTTIRVYYHTTHLCQLVYYSYTSTYQAPSSRRICPQELHGKVVKSCRHEIINKQTCTIYTQHTIVPLMTFPRVDSDLLMAAPSCSRAPVAPVESALSL